MANAPKMVKVKVTSGKHHIRRKNDDGVMISSPVIAGSKEVIEVTRNTYERCKDKFALVTAAPLSKVADKTTTQTRRDDSKKKDEPKESSRSRTIGNL